MPRIAYLRSFPPSAKLVDRLPNKLNNRPTPRYPSSDGDDSVAIVTVERTVAGIRSLSVPALKKPVSILDATKTGASSRCA